MVMSLDDFIKKYGPESGSKRYHGLQKALATRNEVYKSHPYTRLTQDWFLWRYPNDGQERWETFVAKSKQSLENFVSRYGLEEGERKYKETVAKKNTVAIKREKDGEQAVKDWYRRSSKTHKTTLRNMPEDQYNEWLSKRVEKSQKTIQAKYGNKSKLQIFIERYGDQGPHKYAEYLQKIFKSIGASQQAENLFKKIINDNSFVQKYNLYYRDSQDPSKAEYFIADKTGVSFYDFCIPECKVILEYDGSRWHPTQEQVDQYGDEIMEITGLSYREKYLNDETKRNKARNKGFSLYIIRSDFTYQQTNTIIEQFINEVKSYDR